MNRMKRELSWWRLLLGLLLVYINGKFLLFPQTRTLQPANAGEATGMLIVDLALIAVGVWLLTTCYRTPRTAGPKWHVGPMLGDVKRIEIAQSLEGLAAQDAWSADVWQRCYDLVTANVEEDELLGYVHDDLIHYTGRRLFRSAPLPKDFNPYRQEFRDVATALRSRMSLADYKKNYQ